jgi:hypothetical protein
MKFINWTQAYCFVMILRIMISDITFIYSRREIDSGSESDISPNFKARQRKAKSVGTDQFETEWQSAMQK